MTLVLDIETVPLDASMHAPYPEADRNPPSNYKSEDAITKWRAIDRKRYTQDRAKECSINPRLGRILCVGTSDGLSMAAEAADEADTLRDTWAWIGKHDGQVVTWNGSWDLRFILMRSLKHGITPSVSADVVRNWFRKYATAPHFDCKAVLLNWDVRVAGEGLSEWATFLGLPPKTDGMSGADVYPLYQGGHLDEIAKYCAQDVAATKAIYEKLAPVFL
jgi:hypothetical protein